ncbi:hypothetical protein OC842_002966 [Tilletia horrida]|uniref:Zn(2)-C6 fungal-type domain-containing protein n=1 Tax=Tilletia horrida TaxID=155126 RepID=A0AAN6JLR1_9BASI|nr:hypothetical protein OC842_002966 [Tilletia horrida]
MFGPTAAQTQAQPLPFSNGIPGSVGNDAYRHGSHDYGVSNPNSFDPSMPAGSPFTSSCRPATSSLDYSGTQTSWATPIPFVLPHPHSTPSTDPPHRLLQTEDDIGSVFSTPAAPSYTHLPFAPGHKSQLSTPDTHVKNPAATGTGTSTGTAAAAHPRLAKAARPVEVDICHKSKSSGVSSSSKKRNTKCKCEPDPHNPSSCSQCSLLAQECTYNDQSKKRGPPKGYIEAIETRLHHMENVLYELMCSQEPDGRTILERLVGRKVMEDIWSGKITLRKQHDPERRSTARASSGGKWKHSWWAAPLDAEAMKGALTQSQAAPAQSSTANLASASSDASEEADADIVEADGAVSECTSPSTTAMSSPHGRDAGPTLAAGETNVPATPGLGDRHGWSISPESSLMPQSLRAPDSAPSVASVPNGQIWDQALVHGTPVLLEGSVLDSLPGPGGDGSPVKAAAAAAAAPAANCASEHIGMGSHSANSSFDASWTLGNGQVSADPFAPAAFPQQTRQDATAWMSQFRFGTAEAAYYLPTLKRKREHAFDSNANEAPSYGWSTQGGWCAQGPVTKVTRFLDSGSTNNNNENSANSMPAQASGLVRAHTHKTLDGSGASMLTQQQQQQQQDKSATLAAAPTSASAAAAGLMSVGNLSCAAPGPNSSFAAASGLALPTGRQHALSETRTSDSAK